MIRKARREDLPQIIEIYAYAREFMAGTGNPTQWGDGYPLPEQLEEDISLERLYVLCDKEDVPHGVFAFMLGDDPSYGVIDGAWLNDAPYGTIHRLAGDGTVKGQFRACLDFCLTISPDIRADTHHNNKVMQHLLEKNGFVRCGEISLYEKEDDPLRIAYQYQGKLENE